MRDPNDLIQYEFVGRLAEARPGAFLRIELLLMVVEGRADLESLVKPSDGDEQARIAEMPALIGEEGAEVFEAAKESIKSTSERYLDRKIRATDYLAAREMALRSRGTSSVGLCSERLEEILPVDPTGSLPLARRVEIMAEVLRKELAQVDRKRRKQADASRERVERSYRRAAKGAKRVAGAELPTRAFVAAVLCGLGLMADIGSVAGTAPGGHPSPMQVQAAIVVGLLSTAIRGPFIAAVVTRNANWRERAAWTLIGLMVLTAIGTVVLAFQAQSALVVAGVLGGGTIKLGWLAFWTHYLGVFATERNGS